MNYTEPLDLNHAADRPGSKGGGIHEEGSGYADRHHQDVRLQEGCPHISVFVSAREAADGKAEGSTGQVCGLHPLVPSRCAGRVESDTLYKDPIEIFCSSASTSPQMIREAGV
jgi:hypothetical protein